MNRRVNSSSTPSLFAFLDVLVCTMGALTLLLISMTNIIRQQAITKELPQWAARAQAANSPPEPELGLPREPEPIAPAPAVEIGPSAEDLAAERERKLAENVRRQQFWQQSLVEAREIRARRDAEAARNQAELTETQEALRRAREESRRLASRVDSSSAARQALAQTEQNLAQQQSQLVQQIAATRRNIDLANRKQATAANEYALVPYDGTSGTLRHPIYIECTGKGFRFLPEGEFLGADELDGFSESYNPLLVGAQTLLKYWTDRHIEDRRDQPQPYVLLIVRPSGSFTYYVARKLLSSLTVGFGYELVEEDWKIASLKPDAGSQEVLREAIAVSLEARQKVRASLANVERRGGYVYSKSQGSQGMLVDPSRAGNESLRGGDPWERPASRNPQPGGGLAGRTEGFNGLAPRGPSGMPGRESGRSPGGPLQRSGIPDGVAIDERRLRTIDEERSVDLPAVSAGSPRATQANARNARDERSKPAAGAAAARPADPGSMPPELEIPGSSSSEPADFTDVGKAAKQPRNGVPLQKKHWGRARSRAAIGLERKLEIVVEPHRIIVGPEQSVVPVNPADPADKLVAAVVPLIEESASNWGLPPANFYWIPSIRFIVDPGANQYHEQLKAGLKKLGLTTAAEFSTPAAGKTGAALPGGGRR